MKPMTCYISIRVFTSLLYLCAFLSIDNILYLGGATVSILFWCEYNEDEFDCYPDVTKGCQDHTFLQQGIGILALIFSVIVFKLDEFVLSNTLIIYGIYKSTYHPYIFFYRKVATLKSERVYREDEISR